MCMEGNKEVKMVQDNPEPWSIQVGNEEYGRHVPEHVGVHRRRVRTMKPMQVPKKELDRNEGFVTFDA